MPLRSLALVALLAAAVFPTSAHAYSDELRSNSGGVLQLYRPIYVLFGRPDTKIQLSAKVLLVPYASLYLGYTQTAFWELGHDSTPVRDIIFAPELFYRFNLREKSWLDLGIFEHESNGKSGADSRSWNRGYLRYSSWHSLSAERPLKFDWSFKAAVPYNRGSGSHDLPKYRGLWELTASLVDFFDKAFDRSDLTFRLYPGGRYDVNPFLGGQELTLRLNPRIRPAFTAITFQVFHGYAETLLDFTEERLGLRIGVGF